MVATRAAPAGPRPGGLAGQRRAGPHGDRLARAARPRAMTAPAAPARLSSRAAAGIVIALWAPYTALNAVFPGPRLTYALGLLIAALALGALRLAGVPPRQCFVRLAPLSWPGAALLAALSTFVPFALLAGRGHPWDWARTPVYPPARRLTP